MTQAKLEFNIQPDEYKPKVLHDTTVFIHKISNLNFSLNTTEYVITVYKIPKNKFFIINHTITDTTENKRTHYTITGKEPELVSQLNRLLEDVNNSIFWKHIYRDLLNSSDINCSVLDAKFTGGTKQFNALQSAINKKTYDPIFRKYIRHKSFPSLFPSGEPIYQDKFIQVETNKRYLDSIETEIAQTLGARKLSLSNVNTLISFDRSFGNNTVWASSDRKKVRQKLQNNHCISCRGSVSTNESKQDLIENILSISTDICFLLDGDDVSEVTIASIVEEDAHVILSENRDIQTVNPVIFTITEKSREYEMECTEDVFTLKSNKNDRFSSIKNDTVLDNSQELQFKPFEILPIKLINKIPDVTPEMDVINQNVEKPTNLS